MLCVLLLSVLIIGLSGARQDLISVSHGIITVDDHKSCNISNSGVRYECTNCETIPGLWFGYIEYTCDGISGFMLSKTTCKDCGVFCSYNEMISGCEQTGFKVAFGMAIGLIMSPIIAWGLHKLARLTTSAIVKEKTYRNHVSKTKKLKKQEKLIEDVMGFKSSMKEAPISPKKQRRLGEKRSRKLNLTTMAIVLFLVCGVLGDDVTYYMRTSGKYCVNGVCTIKESAMIQLLPGSTVRLNTKDGDIKITLIESFDQDDYVAYYRTSDFTVKVSHKSNCKGASECQAGKCHNDYIYSGLNSSLPESSIQGFGCDPTSLGNPEWWGCTHHRMCVWYKYALYPEGQSYIVYKWVKSVKYHKIRVTGETISEEVLLSESNPQHNVLNSISKRSLSYQLLSQLSPTSNKEAFGIIINDVLYKVPASSYNSPMVFSIGDLQMELETDKMIYPINHIRCFATDTSAKCVTPEPYIKTIKNSLHNYFGVNDYIKGLWSVSTKEPKSMTATILISNIAVDSLTANDATCRLSLTDTFSCLGCVKENYAVFKSSDIKTEGLMPFTSNCSFTTNYLPCGPGNHVLNYLEFNSCCELLLIKTNQTIIVNNNRTVKVSLSDLRLSSYTSSYTEDLKNAVVNVDFFKGLSYTIAGTTLVTTFLTMFYRLGQLYIVKKNINIETN